VSEIEQPLRGGRLTDVVRVGDTVRRGAGEWTPAVQALLKHLEARGLRDVPRALGVDEQGREVLSFVSGETIAGRLPWPEWTRTPETLSAAAVWLRGYHAAVADFSQPVDTRWRSTTATPQAGEIVCHNDWAPYNAVWVAAGPLAAIDWDTAGPGLAVEDVAFAAWNFVPLWDDAHCRETGWNSGFDRARRLASFLDAYGLDSRRGFIERVVRRMQTSIDRIETGARDGDGAFVALVESGRLDTVRAARERVVRDATLLARAIA
jgi:hypothetical protein